MSVSALRATISVSKKGHASQQTELRSRQNERVMPSRTLLRMHCQAETEPWMFTTWGDEGRNFWASLTPPPCPHSLSIHTVCATWSYSYMPMLLRGLSPFSDSSRKGVDSDTVRYIRRLTTIQLFFTVQHVLLNLSLSKLTG